MYQRQERENTFRRTEIAERWEEYIQELFQDSHPAEITLEFAETDPSIPKSEVEWALK